jgi:hypothetical protein
MLQSGEQGKGNARREDVSNSACRAARLANEEQNLCEHNRGLKYNDWINVQS